MNSVAPPHIYVYRRVIQAKLFIDTHYHQPLDLDAIADEAAFSKYHFIRLFRKAYGKNPHQYLTTVRLEKARLLLAEGVAVSDVCQRVGFESLSSFSGLFKKYTGVTPSAYTARQAALRTALRVAPLQFVPACFAASRGWLPQ